MNKISNNISINQVRFDEIMIYEFVKNIYCKGDAVKDGMECGKYKS